MRRVVVLAAVVLLTMGTIAHAKKGFDLNAVQCIESYAASSKKVGAVNPDAWQLGIKGETPMLAGESGKCIVTFVLDKKAAKPTAILVAAAKVAGDGKDAMAQASSIMAMNAVVDMTAQLPAQQRMDLVSKLVDKTSGGKEAQIVSGQVAYTLSITNGTLLFMATPAANLK